MTAITREALKHAGAMLSNCAFNLAQRKPGEPLTEADIRALDESRKAWDAARSAQQAAAGETEGAEARKIAAQAMLIKAQEQRLSACNACLDEAREARATLESERQANAILTAEIEALRGTHPTPVSAEEAQDAEALLANWCEASGTFFHDLRGKQVSNIIQRDDLLQLIRAARGEERKAS